MDRDTIIEGAKSASRQRLLKTQPESEREGESEGISVVEHASFHLSGGIYRSSSLLHPDGRNIIKRKFK